MLVLVAVVAQIRPVQIPLKVRLDLVGDIDQIGVDREIGAAIVIPDRPDALGFGLDGIHDTDCVRHPDECRFPIHAFQNSLHRLVGRNRIAVLLSSYTRYGVAEQSISSPNAQGNRVAVLQEKSPPFLKMR